MNEPAVFEIGTFPEDVDATSTESHAVTAKHIMSMVISWPKLPLKD
jgi:hypothetical protein